ncbi:hypothetical protein FSP39_011489 [Pinctada imbricata]|uniref:Uncharacterized protein n=1 Tax=Pinctada imbricata TaxID=66713 RepID=A0AA88XE75_PINIB|nr:hypothetical protein FSP39_011489 [Pinctada imbricata]
MELLIKNKCNIQVKDNYGFSLLRTIFKTNSIVKPEAIKLLQKYGYNIDSDRSFLEDLLEKSRDANDKLYAEMLLGNQSIKTACENPFSTQGWYHRRSSLNRRISVISEVSLSFVYGDTKPSFMD